MRFNDHFRLVGAHSFLSASKYHWVNYTDEQFDKYMLTQLAAQRGTELHELAARLIKMGVRLPDTSATLNRYVNDAIGYRMDPERVLFYSENCFGTADAISFRDNLLRVHDLKTGVTQTSMRQLLVYNAMFCLEYGYSPTEIAIENRIYQNDECRIESPAPMEVQAIMSKIIAFDKRAREIREEGH